jgi:hypothetical protein
MGVITKREIKGNPPRSDAAATAKADEAPARTTNVLGTSSISPHSIGPVEAREQGENAVTRGALERAERHVSGFSIIPSAGPQPKRITVNREGKIIPAEEATEGATVLVGAEAEAYEAAHGGKKAEDKAPNKAKRKAANKNRRTATAARRKGR